MTTVAAPAAPAARADVPNDLAAFWLPFTPNRAFKKRPRLLARSKDMHYYTPEGREVLDATAALWCCNAGHNRQPIVEAIQRQAADLDFAPVRPTQRMSSTLGKPFSDMIASAHFGSSVRARSNSFSSR